MKIRFGYRNTTYPNGTLGTLQESQHLLPDMQALHAQMAEDGYLLLRGLIDREKVKQARATILHHMHEQNVLTPDAPILEGVMPRGGRGAKMRRIAYHEDVLSVIQATELFDFFAAYFGEPALTFDYKWLRAVGNEQYTGAHYDFVYMGRGSGNLHTVWIPLGDTTVDHGTLAVCKGSHNLPSFARIRDTYGRMDVDRDGIDGWFTKDPMEIVEKFGGEWQTGEFFMGDVILFGMHTMHASTTNLTNRFRLSCDVRFQPASDPADERWVAGGPGHIVHGIRDLIPIETARAQWGLPAG
ncbi:MAG: phytanoyl-CoA dioxygenase family protein [Caldilineaceae bacterium SB0670_bin_27]|uniref:Phytanoyl-CoA dioxygenase family protein n=1 Tax=Caldilineaceae bacterium SB0664_bin_27 TaxID=2605260 RepID=A0A6B0YWY4_9CHLR|nr:phytanoyl-CoA dioxygenase family protein [Caldilineaceae bacterium SB0664_bin_27]MYJ77387.1 phytanoyl-CoA dioxygenase family protein [Caldilineaceae bacterium SB0670_bin_27]